MKHLKLTRALALCALLLAVVLLFVACDKDNDKPTDTESATDTQAALDTGVESDTDAATDADTDVETDAQTDAQTESDTAPAVESETIHAPAYLDALIEADNENPDNGKFDMDMSISVSANADGYEQSMTVPMQMIEIIDGTNVQIIANSMGEEYTLTYVGGTLYFTYGEELYRCTSTAEQFEEAKDILSGSDGEDGDTDDASDLLADLKASEIFAFITAEVKSDGSVTITARGINQDCVDEIAPYVMPFLYSLGMVGNTVDWDSIESDEQLDAALIAETEDVLATVADDMIVITFMADKDGNLTGLGIDMNLSYSTETDGVKLDMTMGISGKFAYTVGGQSVKAPANADKYTEVTWDDLFASPSAEDYDLVPDEDGIIYLSDDAEFRYEQLSYIYTYPEEFYDYAFVLDGSVQTETLTDGSTVLYIYTQDADGNLDEYSSIYGMFDPESEEELKASIATGEEAIEAVYTLVGVFTPVEDELGDEYITFLVVGVFSEAEAI